MKMIKDFLKTRIGIIIVSIFFIYILLISGGILASRTVPCGEICAPERPFVYPNLAKAFGYIGLVIISPLFIISPLMEWIDDNLLESYLIIAIIIFSYIFWVFLIWVLSLVYSYLIKKIKRGNKFLEK